MAAVKKSAIFLSSMSNLGQGALSQHFFKANASGIGIGVGKAFAGVRSFSSAGGEDEIRDFGQYEIVKPGKFPVIRALKQVPAHIPKPDYYVTGRPKPYTSVPDDQRFISSFAHLEKLRAACKLARATLKHTVAEAKVGVTTDHLDTVAHNFIISNNAYPSPLNYKGFPKSICTSVNNVAIHGIPDDRPLLDGDIVNLDVTVFLNGFHGDCSETVLIGNVDPAGVKLVEAVKECLERGIHECYPGAPFNAIGTTIEAIAHMKGFNVIPVITGHGIGQYFHGPPDIYHVAYPYPGTMRPGMAFTIEPVLSQGGEDVTILKDGWTTVTEDNARTAQFEHTILVTSGGFEILTK